ncbi:MBL fold metallo-hydrolase [Candidatus Uhrbacteria bacterium]|nr:MBL fold metallo-hydrolase [Candidatus Uhrbacteria bacterium]
MLKTAVRLTRLTEAAADLKQTIYKGYRSLVPPQYRTAARWVWGIFALSSVLWFQGIPDGAPLTVHFYDVGQGDAIHVRTAQGFDVLIDGGPSARVVEKLGRTLPFWDRTIELLILTHPHADHLVGQIEVLRRFTVKQVLATGVLHTTDEYLEWLKEIKNREIPMAVAKASQEFPISLPTEDLPKGDNSQFPNESQIPIPKLEILWPQEDLSGKRIAEKSEADGGLNATSIAAKLTYGKTSFLFTGDAEEGVEDALLSPQSSVHGSRKCQNKTVNCELITDDSRLRSDVLKVGHHGSKTSTSKEFLQAVAPKYAVIQSGRKNRFGHPHFQTLWRLKQQGVEILRNDQDGDVVFESDGTALQYRVQRKK